MSILLNEVCAIQLQELFGQHCQIQDVEVVDEFIHFSIPATLDSDPYLTVNLTFCGVHDGQVNFMLTQAELNGQIRTKDFLKINLNRLLGRLDRLRND